MGLRLCPTGSYSSTKALSLASLADDRLLSVFPCRTVAASPLGVRQGQTLMRHQWRLNLKSLRVPIGRSNPTGGLRTDRSFDSSHAVCVSNCRSMQLPRQLPIGISQKASCSWHPLPRVKVTSAPSEPCCLGGHVRLKHPGILGTGSRANTLQERRISPLCPFSRNPRDYRIRRTNQERAPPLFFFWPRRGCQL